MVACEAQDDADDDSAASPSEGDAVPGTDGEPSVSRIRVYPVVVKVQRPDADKVVDTDLDILVTQARFVASHSEMGERYDVTEIASEFADAVRGELDYLAEAKNAERLARHVRKTTTPWPSRRSTGSTRRPAC